MLPRTLTSQARRQVAMSSLPRTPTSKIAAAATKPSERAGPSTAVITLSQVWASVMLPRIAEKVSALASSSAGRGHVDPDDADPASVSSRAHS
jgi:hypothetical protein